MIAVLLTIHVIIVLALVGVVLLQRSEGGGALGIGGGNSGGLMSGRSAATALTRTTTILAACFFVSSLALAVITDRLTETDQERAERLTGEQTTEGGEVDTGDLLDIFDTGATGTAPDSAEGSAATGEAPSTAEDAGDTVTLSPENTDLVLDPEDLTEGADSAPATPAEEPAEAADDTQSPQ